MECVELAPALEPRHTSDSGSKLHALHTLRETRRPLSSVCAICSVSPGNLRKKTRFSHILFSAPAHAPDQSRRAEDRRALPAHTDRLPRQRFVLCVIGVMCNTAFVGMNIARDINHLALQQQTRRVFLGRAGRTLGSVALASLLNPGLIRAALASSDGGNAWRGVVHPPHHPPKVKRVIWLTMAGGPSHLETFDFKPKLAQMDGQPMPESMTAGQQLAQLQGEKLVCWGPQYAFKRYGRCGAEITELFPHVGAVADELCIIRSMTTDAINHDPAHTFMNPGSPIVGRA